MENNIVRIRENLQKNLLLAKQREDHQMVRKISDALKDLRAIEKFV